MVSKCFKKYIVEFLGTYFLVLTIGCMINLETDKTLAPIIIGLVLAVMVYAGGKISGGHYNPAVSLAVYLNKGICNKRFFGYIVSQFFGGIIAACTVNYLADGTFMPMLGFYMPALILAETLFTFLLCLTVLFTTRKEVSPNCYYGAAIGSSLTVGIASVGSTICLAAFNPAVALSLAFMNGCCICLSFVTILANFAGGAFAYLLFKFITNENRQEGAD